MQYMTHPKHGAYHATDEGEIERLEKSGWKKSAMPTADEIRAIKRGQLAEGLKAQLAELGEPVVAPARKKPGPKPKAA